MKTTGPKIRVLIADDHPPVLAGLASIIGMQPDMVVIAQASDGRQLVEHWLQHRPDVTLLDLRMPVLDGVGVINEVRQHESTALRNIFTKLNSNHVLIECLDGL